MENNPRYWSFVRGIHRSPVNSSHKGQWCGVLMFSLICSWIDRWVNYCEAGDLRRHRAHYEVTVMRWTYKFTYILSSRLCEKSVFWPSVCLVLTLPYTFKANPVSYTYFLPHVDNIRDTTKVRKGRFIELLLFEPLTYQSRGVWDDM